MALKRKTGKRTKAKKVFALEFQGEGYGGKKRSDKSFVRLDEKKWGVRGFNYKWKKKLV